LLFGYTNNRRVEESTIKLVVCCWLLLVIVSLLSTTSTTTSTTTPSIPWATNSRKSSVILRNATNNKANNKANNDNHHPAAAGTWVTTCRACAGPCTVETGPVPWPCATRFPNCASCGVGDPPFGTVVTMLVSCRSTKPFLPGHHLYRWPSCKR